MPPTSTNRIPRRLTNVALGQGGLIANSTRILNRGTIIIQYKILFQVLEMEVEMYSSPGTIDVSSPVNRDDDNKARSNSDLPTLISS